MEMLESNQSVNELLVATRLHISKVYAETLLSLLVREGKAHCDVIIGGRALYTSPNLLENIVINKIIEKIETEGKRIIARGRFIKLFSKYEIDAFLEWEENGGEYDALVEIKRIRSTLNMDKILYQWMLMLEQIRDKFIEHKITFSLRWPPVRNIFYPVTEEDIKNLSSSVICYLILIVEEKSDFVSIQNLIQKYSAIKDVFNIEILAYNREEMLNS